MPVGLEKSIKEKLQRVIALTTVSILAVASCSIIVFEWRSYRQAALHAWGPLAEVLADNGGPALAFHDPVAAKKTLAVLRFQTGIRGAWLYTPDGQILGDYNLAGEHPVPVQPDRTVNAAWLEGRDLLLTCQVKLRGEPVGWLTLRADLRAEQRRLRYSTFIVVGCLVLAWLVALMIAYRLQRAILNPIHGLALVADAVAARHDYSLRVPSTQPDELGRLTDAFNDMLEQIERRDAQLAETRAQLASAEEKYRQLVERVPVVTYTAEFGPAGRWHFVSPQIEALLGYAPADWLREPGVWFQHVFPDDRARALVPEADVRVTGKYALEYRMVTRTGRLIWVRDEGVTLREPGQPEPLLHGILRDVSERQQSTAALGEMRQRFEDLYNSATDAIGYADLDGRLIHVNPAFEKLTGYTRDELRLRLDDELTPPEFHEMEQRLVNAVVRTGQAASYEKEYQCKDGTRVPVALTRFLVRNADGQATGIATIARVRPMGSTTPNPRSD